MGGRAWASVVDTHIHLHSIAHSAALTHANPILQKKNIMILKIKIVDTHSAALTHANPILQVKWKVTFVKRTPTKLIHQIN